MKKIIFTLLTSLLLFTGCGLSTKYVYEIKHITGSTENITIDEPIDNLKVIGGELKTKCGCTTYSKDIEEISLIKEVPPTQSEIDSYNKDRKSYIVLSFTSLIILVFFIIAFRNKQKIKNSYNKVKTSTMLKILKWMFCVFGIILVYKIGLILIKVLPPIVEHFFK